MSELPSDPLSEDEASTEDPGQNLLFYDNYPENETLTVR
jgi:hypothetical protein